MRLERLEVLVQMAVLENVEGKDHLDQQDPLVKMALKENLGY